MAVVRLIQRSQRIVRFRVILLIIGYVSRGLQIVTTSILSRGYYSFALVLRLMSSFLVKL